MKQQKRKTKILHKMDELRRLLKDCPEFLEENEELRDPLNRLLVKSRQLSLF